MNITIIGTGNVATILGQVFLKNGHDILQIIGRREDATKELSDTLKCPYTLCTKEINQHSDLYIVAVSDKAIEPLTNEIIIPKQSIIVHTAGGVSINVFKDKFDNYGVLYPLQSLRKENNYLPEIPFFIDGNKTAKGILYDFAKTISDKTAFADDYQRINLHISAVFASNFPNFLYVLAYDFCNKRGIEFSNLIPLMEETIHRLKYFNPDQMQTGPAIRKDVTTVEKHLQQLKDDGTARNTYRFLSEEIMKYFQ